MDFSTLVQEGLSTLATNATEGTDKNAEQGTLYTIIEHLGDLLGSQLSPVLHILMVLNNMGGNRLGVDPATILAAFGMFWFAEQLFYQVYYKIQGVLQEHFAVEVAIDEEDKIYNHMINWIATPA